MNYGIQDARQANPAPYGPKFKSGGGIGLPMNEFRCFPLKICHCLQPYIVRS